MRRVGGAALRAAGGDLLPPVRAVQRAKRRGAADHPKASTAPGEREGEGTGAAAGADRLGDRTQGDPLRRWLPLRLCGCARRSPAAAWLLGPHPAGQKGTGADHGRHPHHPAGAAARLGAEDVAGAGGRAAGGRCGAAAVGAGTCAGAEDAAILVEDRGRGLRAHPVHLPWVQLGCLAGTLHALRRSRIGTKVTNPTGTSRQSRRAAPRGGSAARSGRARGGAAPGRSCDCRCWRRGCRPAR